MLVEYIQQHITVLNRSDDQMIIVRMTNMFIDIRWIGTANQFVNVDKCSRRPFVEHVIDKIRTDKSATARD